MTRVAREEQRKSAREALPASPTVLKEMFDFLDQNLEEAECDHTLRLTKRFIYQNGLDEAKVIGWLNNNGGYCDCEVLNNAEQAVSEALIGYEDIGTRSVQ